MRKIVLTGILILLILICVGFYVFDVAYNKTPLQENLAKVVFTMAALILSVVRLHVRDGQKRRAGLALYEKTYEKEIGSAFYNKPAYKKKLLEAIRLYDENAVDGHRVCGRGIILLCKSFACHCYSRHCLCGNGIIQCKIH